MPTQTTGWRSLYAWLLIFACAGILYGSTYHSHVQVALDPRACTDDARQQMFPFLAYMPDSAFVDDYAAHYFLANYPVGFKTLYYVAVHAGMLYETSKLLPYVLVIATAFFLAQSVKPFGGMTLAGFSFLFVLGNEIFLERMVGGLSRGFGFPLIALLMWGLSTRRWQLQAIACIGGALFYPAAGVLAGVSLTLYLFLVERAFSFRRRLFIVTVIGMCATLCVLPVKLSSSAFGQFIRAADVNDFPEAGKGGRYISGDHHPYWNDNAAVVPIVLKLFQVKFDRPQHQALFSSKTSAALLWFLGLNICTAWGLWSMLRTPQRMPLRLGVAIILSTAAFSCYIAAYYLAPFFYIPVRYLTYSISLLAVFVIAILIAWLATLLGSRLPRHCRPLIIAALAVLPLYLSQPVRAKTGYTVTLDPIGQAVTQYVSTLPVESVLTGWPTGPIDNIPYFSKRRVLVSFEAHQAFQKDFVLEMRRRMVATIHALYSSDDAALIHLYDTYGVTHMLVNPQHFKKAPSYFKPFRKLARDAFLAEANGTPAAKRLADAATTKHVGPYYFIDVRALKTHYKTSMTMTYKQ